MRIHLLFFISIFYCLQLFSQNKIELSSVEELALKPSAYEKINKVIAATNGKIIAVGDIFGKGKNDRDGLFIVINSEDMSRERTLQFGKPDQDEILNSVVQNNDGTFTAVGYTSTGKKGNKNGWIINLDVEGTKVEESFPKGTPDLEEEIIDVAVNQNGTILAVGLYYDKKGKTNSNWVLQFKKGEKSGILLEDPELGPVKAVIADQNNDFLLMGNTSQNNRKHPDDIWVVKLDEQYNYVWGGIKYFGDKETQLGFDITPIVGENGFAIAGLTSSNSSGKSDMLLMKVDSNGEQLWSKKYAGKLGEGLDIANAVIELSEGGFAILGQTKSHMAKAEHTNLYLIVTDSVGNQLDTYLPFVREGQGDELGHDLVELFSGEDIIISGSARHRSNETFPAGLVEIVKYKIRPIRDFSSEPEAAYGNAQKAIDILSMQFTDSDGDDYLAPGERGYFTLQLQNNSFQNLNNLRGIVSSKSTTNNLDHWDEIKFGTIRLGQTKKVFVPIQALNSVENISDLNIEILEGERLRMESNLTFGNSDQINDDPARLVVSNYSLTPERPLKAGELGRLQLNIINTGTLPSRNLNAYFNLPKGVESVGSQLDIRIPIVPSRNTYSVVLNFAIKPTFKGNSTPIHFICDDMPSLNKEFNVRFLPTNQTATNTPTASKDEIELYWVNPRPGVREVNVNNRDVNITAMSVSEGETSKSRFKILINGNRTRGQKMDRVKLGPPEETANEKVSQIYENTIRLKDGINKVQIVYYDENDNVIVGKSKTTIFNYTPKDKPNLYVLSIGVEHDDLDFTIKDSKDFADYYNRLKKDSRLFGNVEIYSLSEKKETEAFNIKAAFIDFSNRQFKDNDLFVVFISSHGKVNNKGEFLLLPSDYNPIYEELSSINFKDDILRKLRVIDGKKLVFIDACHSGKIGGKNPSNLATSKLVQDLIQSTSGMEIFASCSDNEFSYEDEKWQNGAFTKAILEAFDNKRVTIGRETIQADIYKDDPNTGEKIRGTDGVITIEELKIFVQKRVPFLVKSIKKESQHPVNKQTELLPENMGIYVLGHN